MLALCLGHRRFTLRKQRKEPRSDPATPASVKNRQLKIICAYAERAVDNAVLYDKKRQSVAQAHQKKRGEIEQHVEE